LRVATTPLSTASGSEVAPVAGTSAPVTRNVANCAVGVVVAGRGAERWPGDEHAVEITIARTAALTASGSAEARTRWQSSDVRVWATAARI
jgi:hypothetical protein